MSPPSLPASMEDRLVASLLERLTRKMAALLPSPTQYKSSAALEEPKPVATEEEGLPMGVIAGAGVGVVVVIVAAALTFYFLYWKKRGKDGKKGGVKKGKGSSKNNKSKKGAKKGDNSKSKKGKASKSKKSSKKGKSKKGAKKGKKAPAGKKASDSKSDKSSKSSKSTKSTKSTKSSRSKPVSDPKLPAKMSGDVESGERLPMARAQPPTNPQPPSDNAASPVTRNHTTTTTSVDRDGKHHVKAMVVYPHRTQFVDEIGSDFSFDIPTGSHFAEDEE